MPGNRNTVSVAAYKNADFRETGGFIVKHAAAARLVVDLGEKNLLKRGRYSIETVS